MVNKATVAEAVTDKLLEESIDKEVQRIIDLESKQYQFNFSGLISSIFYLIIFIALGLPIWYKTTTPERWPMPDVSTLMVRSQTLTHYYKISVVFLDSTELTNPSSQFDISRLRSFLQNNHGRRQSYDRSLSFVNDWTVRNAFEKELKASEFDNSTSNVLNLLDQSFAKDDIQMINSIVFYILPRNYKADSFVNFGQYKAIFVDLNHMPIPVEEEGEDAHSILGSELNRQIELVQAISESFYSYQPGDNDQNIMLLLARNFDFIFDVIYEDEDNISEMPNDETYLQSRKLRHKKLINNIDKLIENFYTNRFNFANYFQINFITQVLHYVLPEDFISSKLIKDNNGTGRLIPVSIVHSMLNRIESRRVEHDNDKSFHLTLFVTSQKNGPLKFYDKSSDTKSSLITTPFRGSILILNQNELAELFVGFHQLIRTFFRIGPNSLSQQNLGQFFTQIEIESIIHALVQKHILKTLNSLESTEKLLKKVSNMVIEKNIAERMHMSLDDSLRAAQLLGENGDVRKAYQYSSTAYSLSEKAFFDPSLLSLLYFPDDQKYAIYLPLFLPICLPLVANIRLYVRLWRYLHSKSKIDKVKNE
ncbi:hypothetical protein BLOT_008156 [Blomia tropicalis]|nr:hypothetical protein BLOT_008156 [Blomia tropicalis]